MIEALLDSSALGLIGVLLGFILGRRERNLRRPTSMYTCDCRHALALHNQKGRCQRKAATINACDCQQYVGPRPMELDA
jgi:hypothetical protein